MAVKNRATMAMIRWHLRSAMSARRVSNANLAKALGVSPVTVSRWKNQDKLPAIGSDEVERIRLAIEELSREQYGYLPLSDLIALEESVDA
jgi:DNA-binding Xre family transcriptional regulator